MIKTEDLIKRIEKLKEELEQTDERLKELEAELEKRKQKVPLGVPAVGKFCLTFDGRVDHFINGQKEPEDYNFNIFPSKESAEKHSEMLLAWRKDGLLANSKCEPIDIEVLKPLLSKGWVAMDKSGIWYWYEVKPKHGSDVWTAEKPASYLTAFNIKHAEDWRESLMECGL